MKLKLLLIILALPWLVKPVFAGEPPTQISPTDGSTVSSSKLEWQAPAYPVCSNPNQSSYRVQVDDDLSFPSSSIDKNNYTRSTSYSPNLTFGTWYWRVMARDEPCTNWSDWSPVWSFTLTEEIPSPTPISTPTPAPTPTPSPKPTPTRTPTPTPTPTPKKSTSPTSTPTPIPTSIPTLIPTSIPIQGKKEITYQIASVAATSTSSAVPATQSAVNVKGEKQTNPFFFAGLIFIFAGGCILGYIYLKKNAKIHFPFGK